MAARWDEALLGVLREGDAQRKAEAAQRVLASKDAWDLAQAPSLLPADQPARPAEPDLVDPKDVPRRGLGSVRGLSALLHALAHIELNAIDLAADMALRFAGAVPEQDRALFVGDWIQVMGEEGLHFCLLAERLGHWGSRYGAFPAHHGLWDAALKTKDDVFSRLAIAPMILEARGLDVTPGLMEKLATLGHHEDAAVLQRIYEDEIGHVRTGVRWFIHLTNRQGWDPETTFRNCVMLHHPQGPKPPFNVWARGAAELPEDWYQSLVPQ